MAKSMRTPERYTDVWSAAISHLFKHVEIEIKFFESDSTKKRTQ